MLKKTLLSMFATALLSGVALPFLLVMLIKVQVKLLLKVEVIDAPCSIIHQ